MLASQRRGRHVVLTVRDRGVGIRADDIGRVFDPYFTTRRTGSGLGLAISKNVVEGLGGTITVSSRLDVGTEITHRPDGYAGAARVTMTPGGRVLLVDDEEKILKTLGRALRDEGHDVTTASRALDGQRLLAEQAFDLLIIDYRMPDRSGMDVVKELVATTPDGERPAIVMMTAHGSVESAVEAMKLGAHDYLQKPFEVDELLLDGPPRPGRAARPHRAAPTCAASATPTSTTTASSAAAR